MPLEIELTDLSTSAIQCYACPVSGYWTDLGWHATYSCRWHAAGASLSGAGLCHQLLRFTLTTAWVCYAGLFVVPFISTRVVMH